MIKRFQSFSIHALPMVKSYTTISNRPSQNPFNAVSIEKMLKLSTSKKCNTPQQIAFCLMIFDSVSQRQIDIAPPVKTAFVKEIHRLIRNSLSYINQVDIQQSLLLTKMIFLCIKDQKFEVDNKLLTDYILLFNELLVSALKKDNKGKYVTEVSVLTPMIIKLRKGSYFLKEIISYLQKYAKNDQQIYALLKIFYDSRFKTTATLSMAALNFLESSIGKKVDSLPINSLLVDELFFRMFLDYKFHYKKPTMGVPIWISKYALKLKEKYMQTQNREITITQKISFLKSFIRLLIDSPIIYESSIPLDLIEFIPYFYNQIYEQLNCIDSEDIYIKLSEFSLLSNYYSNYLKAFPYSEALAHYQIFAEIVQEINHRYYSNVNYLSLNATAQKKVLESLQKFCMFYYLTMTGEYGGKYGVIRVKNVMKFYCQLVKVFVTLLYKNKQAKNYLNIFPLLNNIGQFAQYLIKQGIPSQSVLSYCSQILKEINTVLTNQSVIKMLAKQEIIGIANFSYVFSKYVRIPCPPLITEMHEDAMRNNLTMTCENYSDCFLFDQNNLQTEIQELGNLIIEKGNQCIAVRNQNTPALDDSRQGRRMDDNKQGRMDDNKQKKMDDSRQKKMDEQIAENLFSTFRNIHDAVSSVNPVVHDFWFQKNQQFILQFWMTPAKTIAALPWKILNSNYRFRYFSISKSSIDIIHEIIRICHGIFPKNGLPEDLVKQINYIFSDRLVQSIVHKKFDQFTCYKYLWFMLLLKNCNLYIVKPIFAKNSKIQANSDKLDDFEQEKDTPGSVSIFKLVEYLYYIVTDFKKPLQLGSLRSYYSGEVVRECMADITRLLEKYMDEKKLNERQVQAFYRNSPTQQILYWLCQQNQLKNNNWRNSIVMKSFKAGLTQKYSKLTQFNILLSLETENSNAFFDSFILQELETLQNSKHSSFEQKIVQAPILIKISYLLLRPITPELLQILKSSSAFSHQQIIQYWRHKNVVLKTVDFSLQVMLQKLLLIKQELMTYSQFQTILNAIISLFDIGRLGEYNRNGQKHPKLQKWVANSFMNFSAQNSSHFLLDYFAIRKYCGVIANFESRLPQLIKIGLQHNQIDLIDHLFNMKFDKVDPSSLMHLLKNLRMRSMLRKYCELELNINFRLEMFMIKLYGLVLFQNDKQLLVWFYENWLKMMDFSDIFKSVSQLEDSDAIIKIGIREKITASLISQFCETEYFVKCIENMMGLNLTEEIQKYIQRSQTALLGTSPLGTSPLGTSPLGTSPLGTSPLGTSPLGTSPLGTSPQNYFKSQTCLFKNENGNYVFLHRDQTLAPEQALQLQYLRTIMGSIQLELCN